MDAQMPRAQDAQERRSKTNPAGARGESVLFETWYDGLDALQGSAEHRAYWADLLKIRRDVASYLEAMRNKKEIGASLDAEIDLPLSPELLARYREVASELRFFFITSECTLSKVDQAPKGGVVVGVISPSNSEVVTNVIPIVSQYRKCIRCWHHRPDVGTHAEHPEICERCVSNLPGGPGEQRLYF